MVISFSPLTIVPLDDLRSWSVQPPSGSTSTRQWNRETRLSHSATSVDSSRPNRVVRLSVSEIRRPGSLPRRTWKNASPGRSRGGGPGDGSAGSGVSTLPRGALPVRSSVSRLGWAGEPAGANWNDASGSPAGTGGAGLGRGDGGGGGAGGGGGVAGANWNVARGSPAGTAGAGLGGGGACANGNAPEPGTAPGVRSR